MKSEKDAQKIYVYISAFRFFALVKYALIGAAGIGVGFLLMSTAINAEAFGWIIICVIALINLLGLVLAALDQSGRL